MPLDKFRVKEQTSTFNSETSVVLYTYGDTEPNNASYDGCPPYKLVAPHIASEFREVDQEGRLDSPQTAKIEKGNYKGTMQVSIQYQEHIFRRLHYANTDGIDYIEVIDHALPNPCICEE